MRTGLFSVLLALTGLASRAGDAEGTPMPDPPPPVRILFSVYLWPNTGILSTDTNLVGIPTAYYDSPEGVQSIPLRRNSSTPLLPYQGPQPLTIFAAESRSIPPPDDAPPGTPPTTTVVKKPFITATIPDGLQRVMLLVFPERTNPDGSMMTVVMPYESETLKPGMARIRNATRRTLVMQFDAADGKLLRLPPDEFIDVSPHEIADSLYPRIYVYELGQDGELKLRHSSKLHIEEEKTNFFLLYAKGRHRLRILRLGAHIDPMTWIDATGVHKVAPPR
jgi:hypothetical protein